MATRLATSNTQWSIRRRPAAAAGRRRGAGDAEPAIPAEFLQSDAVTVEEVLEAEPVGGRRAAAAAPTELPLEVDVKPGEVSLIAIRHPSGALTFHASSEARTRSVRRRAGAARVDRYRIPIRNARAAATGRRGLISKAIKVVVLKIAKAAIDKAAGAAMRFLAGKVESAAFAKRGVSEGWFKVTPAGASLRLTPGTPPTNQRSLILVHGTFSHAASAYKDLAASDFFERVRPLYGDRVFAFNHFSVSLAPIENAQKMLRELKPGSYTFDAITHSRGGLVLRALVEQRDQLGSSSVNVTWGQAVLVAAPNDGTPLATPSRVEETIGWFGNLLELFPDNPFTTVAEFVSEAIVWLAARVAGDLPGLRSMDGGGDLIAALQLPPGPPANTYSALASNYHPTTEVFARALDVGVDSFFASANDLVVPSEGGWRIDRDNAPHIPGARIGCFGPGGNLATGSTTLVHHMNFFSQPDAVDFLAKALAGRPQGRPSLDPNAPLPSHRFGRRGAATVTPATAALSDAAAAPPLAATGAPHSSTSLEDDTDTFHIVVMDDFDTTSGKRNDPGRDPAFAQVYATYGGARVTQAMRVHQDRKNKGKPVVDPAAKTAFGAIIRTHERIKSYTDLATGSLPDDAHLKVFGSQLFDTLFQGDVRRLYDEARSRQRGRRLDLILTSMVPWIAEKPWEFAYDTSRNGFLATEEIHFVRNVLTSVPADPIIPVNGPLRILVAAAQPVAFGMLSIDEEIEVIRRGFEPMVENNLVTIDVLAQATPAGIHGYISTGHYNIVHFIGHGEFNKERNEGCLVFEDGRGGDYRVGERSLREIFCQRGLSLVFLNACQTGTGGRSDFNKGVAQALVSHGLPALVANQYSVLDSSATSFAQHFYFSLAQGLSLGQAAREARIAVNYALQGEPIDWAIPVLYARDPNRTIARKPERPIRVPVTAVRPTSRRAVRDHTLKIAVWDIDETFPEIDRTLQTMNGAQTVYGFQEAKLSLPLDVWDLASVPGTRYLRADQLAKRLQSKPGELHVDLLVCVTRQWMRDEEWFNLYGWWPDDQQPKVAVFSCAGFDQLKPRGPETERVIANNVVSVLAGFLGNLGTHVKGARDCPLAFNESRDWKHVAGELKFDAGCREKLRRMKLGPQLRAMDTLLKLFKSPISKSAKTGK